MRLPGPALGGWVAVAAGPVEVAAVAQAAALGPVAAALVRAAALGQAVVAPGPPWAHGPVAVAPGQVAAAPAGRT
jgi:hypothetical protein